MVSHSNILAWRIPQTEEPGELQSMGSQRVRYDWVTNTNRIHSWTDELSGKQKPRRIDWNWESQTQDGKL